MIEKLKKPKSISWDDDVDSCIQRHKIIADTIDKVNEIVEAVNTIQKEREAERFEIQEWIGILGEVRESVNKLETMAKNTNTVLKSLVEENNIHKKQINELQMKLEPEKCKAPADPYAEQRGWVGKFCKFWDDNDGYYLYEILTDINCSDRDYPYKIKDASFKYCEPVSEDKIYKGE